MFKKLRNVGIVVLAPVVLYIFFLILRPESFGKFNTVYITITQSFITCIIAYGMQYLARMGEFDMSLGAEIILDCIVAALLSRRLGIAGIVIGCLVTGIVCGILKGLLYRVMRIPVMIMTISIVYLMGAIGGLITGSSSVTIPYEYTFFGRAPGNFILFIIAVVLMYFIANRSIYGAHVNAVAGSPAIAAGNGIRVTDVKVRALFLSSLFAALAAIIQLSHGSGVTPSVNLDSIQNIMEPLMSVFIGFVMAQFVNIVGAIFAASVMMSIISNGITALNWSSSIYNVVVGTVLVLIMAYMSVANIHSIRKTEKDGAIANMKALEMYRNH